MSSMLESMIVYPGIALIWAALLFMHLGIRSLASSLALIIFTYLATAGLFIHLPDLAEIALLTIFLFAFLISAASIPIDANRHRRPAFLDSGSALYVSDASLRIAAAISIAISLSAAILYWYLGTHGASHTLGLVLAPISLSGFVLFSLLIGVSIRRRAVAKLGA